jgi:cytochrome c biogenesis protein ResB
MDIFESPFIVKQLHWIDSIQGMASSEVKIDSKTFTQVWFNGNDMSLNVKIVLDPTKSWVLKFIKGCLSSESCKIYYKLNVWSRVSWSKFEHYGLWN